MGPPLHGKAHRITTCGTSLTCAAARSRECKRVDLGQENGIAQVALEVQSGAFIAALTQKTSVARPRAVDTFDRGGQRGDGLRN